MKKFAIIGKNIENSTSTYIFNYLFQYLSTIDSQFKDYEYLNLPTEIDNLESHINNLKNNNYFGLNITKPYKTEICKYIDCAWANSINCLRLERGKWRFLNRK